MGKIINLAVLTVFLISHAVLAQGKSRTPLPRKGSESRERRQNVGEYKHRILADSDKKFTPLTGHVPPAVRLAEQVDRKDPNEVLQIAVRLKYNNEDELHKLMKELSDPASPNFGRFLTSEEFTERFHPTAEQVAAAKAFLDSHGIQSGEAIGILIHAEGKVADIEAAFQTEISYGVDDDGTSFFAPMYELQVPEGTTIVSVTGLTNAGRIDESIEVVTTDSEPLTADSASLGPLAATIFAREMSPDDVRNAYDLPAELDCSGETIGLAAFGGWLQSDLDTFRTEHSLPTPNIQVISVNGGGPTSARSQPTTVMIESIMAMCPHATKIVVYLAPSSSEANVQAVLNKIANPSPQPLTMIVGNILAFAERTASTSRLDTQEAFLTQMFVQGQTFVTSVGNSGAYFTAGYLSISSPASSPHVLAVGGTTFYSSTPLGTLAEYATEESVALTTGGYSSYYPIPTWQRSVISKWSQPSTTMRNIPDVAMNAALTSSYHFRYGTFNRVGGCGLATMMWTSFLAMVNQQRVLNGSPRLSNVIQEIYRIGRQKQHETFNDVFRGVTNGFYGPVTGLDQVTGFGSFKGRDLIRALQ